MANLQLKELTKPYNQGNTLLTPLDGCTMGIGDAAVVAVVGRSGAG